MRDSLLQQSRWQLFPHNASEWQAYQELLLQHRMLQRDNPEWCGVPGVSISPVFCNMSSTAGVLLKGWWLSKPVAMCCKDLVQIEKGARSCFFLWLTLMLSSNQLLLGPVWDPRHHPCYHLQLSNLSEMVDWRTMRSPCTTIIQSGIGHLEAWLYRALFWESKSD